MATHPPTPLDKNKDKKYSGWTGDFFFRQKIFFSQYKKIFEIFSIKVWLYQEASKKAATKSPIVPLEGGNSMNRKGITAIHRTPLSVGTKGGIGERSGTTWKEN